MNYRLCCIVVKMGNMGITSKCCTRIFTYFVASSNQFTSKHCSSFSFYYNLYHCEFKYSIEHSRVYLKLSTLCNVFAFLVHLSLAIKELLT